MRGATQSIQDLMRDQRRLEFDSNRGHDWKQNFETDEATAECRSCGLLWTSVMFWSLPNDLPYCPGPRFRLSLRDFAPKHRGSVSDAVDPSIYSSVSVAKRYTQRGVHRADLTSK